MVAIDLNMSSKVAAMTHELLRSDLDSDPRITPPRPQDPSATVQTHLDRNSPGAIKQLWDSLPEHYDVFTAKVMGANGTSATISIDGSKRDIDAAVEFTDGDGNHASVKSDGSATLDGNGKHGTQRITPGTVVQVGDAKVRFNFSYFATNLIYNKDQVDSDLDHAVLTSIDIMTGSGAKNDMAAPVVKTINVSANYNRPRVARMNGELYVQGDQSPHWATPNPDENDSSSANNALSSVPALFEDAHQNIMIRNPEVRLGAGALFALPQVGTAGGKLEPGALTLNQGGTIDNQFTSVLDPLKIDSSEQLP